MYMGVILSENDQLKKQVGAPHVYGGDPAVLIVGCRR